MERNRETATCGGGWRFLLHAVRALALVAAVVFTAAATPATADSTLDLVFSHSEGTPPPELHALDDGDLAEVRARGLVGPSAAATAAKKKIVLWDEAYYRNPAAPGPHMTPNGPGASNSVSRRGGW